jgi:predicted dehydrogenase
MLQNIISHGIARIAEYLVSDTPRVIAVGFVSPVLRSLGERGIVDELRVIVSDDAANTAYFTFSSQLRPSLHQFRILGSRNGLLLDQDHETLIRLSGTRRKSYLEQFVPPFVLAKQYLGNLAINARTFLARDFHSKAGMKYLIDAFYRSIREDTAPPISSREIVLTSRIMDSIFEQLSTHTATGRD